MIWICRLTGLQKLVYYDTDPYGEKVKLTSASLFPTINGAAKGTLAYKHSENVVERLARVSLLASLQDRYLPYFNTAVSQC